MDAGETTAVSQDPLRPAGLVRRLLALALDVTIVGLVGLAIAVLFQDAVASLGPAGRLIGLAIALPYYGILNAAPGEGQTLGKRLARIRVVDASGAALPVARAMLRSLVIGTPLLLNQLPLPFTFMRSSPTGTVVGTLLSIAVFGVGGAVLVTPLVNRAARQGLHDLVARSFVVMDGPQAPVAVRTPRWVVSAATGWIALAAAASLVLALVPARDAGPEAFRVLADVALGVERVPGVLSASTSARTLYSSGGRRTELVVRAWTARADLAPTIARAALAVPGADAHDALRVQLEHVADVGIAHWSVVHGDVRAPAEWRAELEP